MPASKRQEQHLLEQHYWMHGLKRPIDPIDKYSLPTTLTRGTSFEPNDSSESKVLEGHTGGTTLDLQTVRTDANAEPEYEHAAIFGEFFHEYFYLAFGEVKNEQYEKITGSTNAYKAHFFRSSTEPQELPLDTIYNGYNGTSTDATIYENSMLNELTITFAEGNVSFKPKFMSWAEITRQPNPLRVGMGDLSSLLADNNVKLYIADYGETLDEATKENYYYECATSIEIVIKNNLSKSECKGVGYGRNVPLTGKFEIDVNVTTLWNEKSEILLNEYKTGEKDGTHPTAKTIFKQVLIENFDRIIEMVDNKPVREGISFHLPYTEVTNGVTPKSGSGAKTIDFTFSLRDDQINNNVDVFVTSEIPELMFGTVGGSNEDPRLTASTP